jgi:RNA-directed DNA polymerase
MEKAASKVCSKKKGQPIFIRYADDFIIFHADREIVEKATKQVTEHLKDMGLWLNPKKTRVTHTLTPYEGSVGFDFLGFTVRQYPVGKTHTGKNTQGKSLGFKTFITPSREAIKDHTLKIKQLIRERRSAPQRAVISAINPVIRGWTNYYKWVVCSKAFHACDHNTFRQLSRWEQARHRGKSKRWGKDKYSISVEGVRRFGTHVKDKEGNTKAVYVRHHTETQSQDYAKVRGAASPYDGNHIYWSQRLKNHPLMKSERAKLLTLQKGQCPGCGLYFQDGDILETDHIVPTALGGKNDISNKWIYHRHCHDEKTAEDLARIAQYKAASINHN